MLETFVRTLPLADESGIRVALYLARDFGREDLRAALAEAAVSCKREELRGMAAAALWDASPPSGGDGAQKMRERSREVAEDLLQSRILSNTAWAALIRGASKGSPNGHPLLTETLFRWIQWGWLE
jgi:hypothetical protein